MKVTKLNNNSTKEEASVPQVQQGQLNARQVSVSNQSTLAISPLNYLQPTEETAQQTKPLMVSTKEGKQEIQEGKQKTISEDQLKRTILTGSLGWLDQSEKVIDLSKLAQWLELFEEKTIIMQKTRELPDGSHLMWIDVNSFREHVVEQFFEDDLQHFLRYLVMTGKICGFSAVRCGFRLDFKDPDDLDPNTKKIQNNVHGSTPFFTKELLLKIDDYMQKLPWPKKNEFTPEQWLTVEIVLRAIKIDHYDRIVNDKPGIAIKGRDLNVFAINSTRAQTLDSLVKKGIIASWNASVGDEFFNVYIKIANSDPHKMIDYRFQWRDLAVIKSEFKI